MPRNELKPLKVDTPEEFKRCLAVLWDELYWANFYYDIFKEAGRLCGEHKEGVNFSPIFWHFTLRAHCQTALVYLHRIYDQNGQSFNLHRFLLTVRDNPTLFSATEVRKRLAGNPDADDLIRAIGTLDPLQLDRDVEFSSNTNPQVANLNRWRDRVTFHKDERELFRQKPFEEEYPLPFAHIDALLDGGVHILNRYGQYFDTAQRSQGCRDWKDMKFVFEALTQHPAVMLRRAESSASSAHGLS